MRIAAITGGRADRGPLAPVVAALGAQWIDVEPAPDDDSRYSVTMDASLVMQAALRQLILLSPDLVLLLGDRYEILAAATAAYLMGLPIAHLSGGDITEGSQDEGMRHAITKLAHLHFPTNAASAARIRAMGEPPDRIHVVGCPGLDRLRTTALLPLDEARQIIGLGHSRHILVCYHPNTLRPEDTKDELAALTGAFAYVPENIGIVIIGPNQDAGREEVSTTLIKFARLSNVVYFEQLNDRAYLTLMAGAAAMVGNSSAGLYEAPWYGTPVIDLGDRQQGRYKARCIFERPFETKQILWTIDLIMGICGGGRFEPDHYYGDGHAAERIAAVIAEIDDPRALLRKRWYDAWPKADAPPGWNETHARLAGGYAIR